MLTTLVVLLAAVQGPDQLMAGEPPTDADVLRALPRVARGVPYVFEQFRDDMVIVKNHIAERKVTLPLPAGVRVTLAVEHWECAVHYTDIVESAFPFPLKVSRKQVQVIYLDQVGLVK